MTDLRKFEFIDGAPTCAQAAEIIVQRMNPQFALVLVTLMCDQEDRIIRLEQALRKITELPYDLPAQLAKQALTKPPLAE